MEIRYRIPDDDDRLFAMMREEGEEWIVYHGEEGARNYRAALSSSTTLVAWEGEEALGFLRARDDDGVGVYVYDLLVRKAFRGRSIGRRLLDRLADDHPGVPLHILSDADGYYEKQGFTRVGSVFLARERQPNK